MYVNAPVADENVIIVAPAKDKYYWACLSCSEILLRTLEKVPFKCICGDRYELVVAKSKREARKQVKFLILLYEMDD